MIAALNAPLEPIPRPTKRKRPATTKKATTKKNSKSTKRKPSRTSQKISKSKKSKINIKLIETPQQSVQHSTSAHTMLSDTIACNSNETSCRSPMSNCNRKPNEDQDLNESKLTYDNISDLFRPHYRNGLHVGGLPAAASVLPATADAFIGTTDVHTSNSMQMNKILIHHLQVSFNLSISYIYIYIYIYISSYCIITKLFIYITE